MTVEAPSYLKYLEFQKYKLMVCDWNEETVHFETVVRFPGDQRYPVDIGFGPTGAEKVKSKKIRVELNSLP